MVALGVWFGDQTPQKKCLMRIFSCGAGSLNPAPYTIKNIRE